MPQKNERNNTIFLAIFRHGDPMRRILTENMSANRRVLHCYNDIFEALSRMPMIDNARKTTIIARQDNLSSDAVAAIATLINPDAAHYVLWFDGSRHADCCKWPFRPANLHFIQNIHGFDDLLKSIESAPLKIPTPPLDCPPKTQRRLTLRTEPLSEGERAALLGANL